jgi:hypothetical protein
MGIHVFLSSSKVAKPGGDLLLGLRLARVPLADAGLHCPLPQDGQQLGDL